jgi:hypothetical protein
MSSRSITSAIAGVVIFGATACVAKLESNATPSDDGMNPPGGGNGSNGGSSAGGSGGGNATTGYFASTRIRRTTPLEYQKTVAALVASDAPAVSFPVDSFSNGYDNKADQLRVTELLAQNLWNSVPEIASRAAQALADAASCAGASDAGESCARELLEPFVARAYRRPASEEELEELMTVFRTGFTGGTFMEGLTLALTVVFQSPDFVYHTELGEAGASGAAVSMTAYETAAALSYLATGGPPDAELTGLAASGEILSADVRAAQAARLFSTDDASDTLGIFAAQWLEAGKLDLEMRDDDEFPEWPELLELAKNEMQDFFTEAVVTDGADFGTLLTANWTVADGALAEFYGGTMGANGRLTLPAGERSGLLTQVAVVGAHSTQVDSSPVQRGHFVRVRLLCQSLPPPPTNIVVMPPPRDPSLTSRERWAATTSTDTCWGCHYNMDPIGYGFENFDAIGRYRSMDAGKPVNAASELTDTDVDGPFDGPVELGQKLAQSSLARECFASHWLEWALGVSPSESARAALAQAAKGFIDGQSSVRDLMVATVRSDRFVLRSTAR